MDEAGRSAKPPLMTASAAEDVISDAASKSSASKPGTSGSSGASSSTAVANAENASAAVADATAISDAVSDVTSTADTSEVADDDADAFSWGTSTWSASSWEASSDSSYSGGTSYSSGSAPSSSSVPTSAAPTPPVPTSSSPASSRSGTSPDSVTSTSLPSSSPSSSSWEGVPPYPADEIGKPKPDLSARAGGSGTASLRGSDNVTTRAEAMMPEDLSAQTGDDQSSSTNLFGTATSAFNSTMDRGRQAWRQALTGPNNWLSSRSSSSPSPSGYAGSASRTETGYTSVGSRASASDGASPATSQGGGTDSSGYSSAGLSLIHI